MKYTTMKFKTIIFLVLVICALFLPPTSAETSYWNTSFSTREPITITTTGTSTPSDYQVLLNISYESEMQADFDDIRFTNSSNGELPYWIESKVDLSYANVWVNLSDAITDPGTDMVWMYYGNDGVGDGGNGADTFLQYHGFESTSPYFNGNNVIPPSNVIAEFRYKILTGTADVIFGLSNTADNTDDFVGIHHNSDYYRTGTKNENVWTFGTSDTSHSLYTTFHRVTLEISDVFNLYIDDASVTDVNEPINANENMSLYISDGGTFNCEWSFVRKYIANDPTTSYGTAQHYMDSIHYNSTAPYNITIESDGTLTSNRSIIIADDTNDTAQSTGTSYLIITAYDNAATIVRKFIFTGDNLDWYQVANISGYYDLKNSGGIIETQSNGNFTTNLIAGTYWIEGSVFSITSIYSLTYSDEAYVMWTTEGLSSNIVEYSLYSDMSSSSWSTYDNATTYPAILITELTRDTIYYYEVSSTRAGYTTTSATLNFSTQNNTHGFSKYFDRAFVVNDIDGWGVGESMFEAYADSVGEYIVWTLILGSVFLVMTIRMESVVVPVVLSLISAAFLFPLLPPEHDIPAKVILGLSITGILWHLFIGRR